MDFSILVLGTVNWPLTVPTSGFNMPDELLATYERFQAFYQHQHSGRKLNWLFQLCKGELKTGYLKAQYTLQVFYINAGEHVRNGYFALV